MFGRRSSSGETVERRVESVVAGNGYEFRFVYEYASDVNSTGEEWSLTAAIAYSSRDAGGV